MTQDRRTKAQILAAHDEMELKFGEALVRIQELENRPVAKIEKVPSADALAGCIRALDLLTPRASDPYNLGGRRSAGQDEIAAVLRHLMQRYGIDLTERITEPCQRPHIEDATEQQLIEALRFGAGRGAF